MPLLSRLQDAVTRPPSGLAGLAAWTGLCVATPTLIRMALDPLLGATLWFPTYYPAALLGALFLGWRAGLLVMLLSAVAANFFFVPPRLTLLGHQHNLAGTLVFLMADGVIVVAAGLLRVALMRLKAAHEREQVLNTELQHRMKNTLAVVQGLVAQTVRRGVEDPKAFQRLLEGRLEALASAHDLLSNGQWATCELPELAARALTPFRDGRIGLKGPPCTLRADCCVPLVLAIHELATNAVKYGALSVDAGRAELSWSPVEARDDAILVRWSERHGPRVVEPVRRGLGARLLTRQPGLEAVELRFRPEGVECEILVRRVKPAERRRSWTDQSADLGGRPAARSA